MALASVTQLQGMPVRDRAGVESGRVRDLVLDTESGAVVYVVLVFSGLPTHPEERTLAVPLQVLHFDVHDRVLVVDVARDELEGAPVAEDELVDDEEFVERMYQHFGVTPLM